MRPNHLHLIDEVSWMVEKQANPAPLGLMGFGMTTVLLNLHNAGFYKLDSMILAMGLAYGGLAQIIAGLLEYRRGNTFGATAFSSYGLFWWSLVALIVMPSVTFVEVDTFSSPSIIAYFVMWGAFTGAMFFGTLKANHALQFVFLSLTMLFFLLALRDYTGSVSVGLLAGYEGIICGVSAIYLAIAEVLNEVYGRTILPVG